MGVSLSCLSEANAEKNLSGLKKKQDCTVSLYVSFFLLVHFVLFSFFLFLFSIFDNWGLASPVTNLLFHLSDEFERLQGKEADCNLLLKTDFHQKNLQRRKTTISKIVCHYTSDHSLQERRPLPVLDSTKGETRTETSVFCCRLFRSVAQQKTWLRQTFQHMANKSMFTLD